MIYYDDYMINTSNIIKLYKIIYKIMELILMNCTIPCPNRFNSECKLVLKLNSINRFSNFILINHMKIVYQFILFLF